VREGGTYQTDCGDRETWFTRIEKLWDENESPKARSETLAAATLDKHDTMVRRTLGMNETVGWLVFA